LRLPKLPKNNSPKLTSLSPSDCAVFLVERLALMDDPRSIGQALRGSELGEFWKYRVGDWRLVCQIKDAKILITVIRLGNRRDVYR